MVNGRTMLGTMLRELLGSSNVYFQPPPTVQMRYPAIVYSRSSIDNSHADNGVYNQRHFYTITVIDPNPDSTIVDRISKLPRCKFDRHFASDNLNHDVFTIYY